MSIEIDKIEQCPVAETIRHLNGKWRPRILWILRNGPTTFGDLCRATKASEKEVTRSLKNLVDDNLIARTPRRKGNIEYVEYSYTTLGLSLIPILDQMGNWGLERLSRSELS